MTPVTAIAFVLAEARRYLPVREKPTLSNRATEIDYWNLEAGAPLGSPWCAAYVGQIGRQALGRGWPCPKTASVQVLTDWAMTRALLKPTPVVGDLFVLWNEGLRRYAHVGFVTGLANTSILTVEGNTNPAGGRDGYGVFERTRSSADAGTRYIRWSEALR